MEYLFGDPTGIYIVQINYFNQLNLRTFYNNLEDKLSLSLIADIGLGIRRPSAEIFEDVWGMPYIVARGREAKSIIRKIRNQRQNKLEIPFENMRRVSGKSLSELARILGYIR